MHVGPDVNSGNVFILTRIWRGEQRHSLYEKWGTSPLRWAIGRVARTGGGKKDREH